MNRLLFEIRMKAVLSQEAFFQHLKGKILRLLVNMAPFLVLFKTREFNSLFGPNYLLLFLLKVINILRINKKFNFY